MQIVLSQVLTAIILSLITASAKMQKGEVFALDKLLRTVIIGVVLGVGATILGFEINSGNFQEVLATQTTMIAITDQLAKIIWRLTKKIKRWFPLLLALPFLVGCAGIRENLIDLSKSDLKNEAVTIEISKNLLQTWETNEGFLRGALGSRIDLLPAQALKSFEEIKGIAIKYNVWNESEYDYAFALGARLRALGSITEATLNEYASDIMKVFPSIINFL